MEGESTAAAAAATKDEQDNATNSMVGSGSMDEGESSDFNYRSGGSGTATPSHGGGGHVKPALKKEDEAKKKAADRHLKWDEKAIEEHDQLRGTRMKIDEPNTPYAHYDSGAESDDSRRAKSPSQNRVTLSWDVLQTKLDSVAAVRAQFPSSPSSHAETDHENDNDTDVEEDQKKEMRKMEFREHRKRHYNEMELVRRYRQEHADEDEDEEDTDGDADVEDGG